MNTPLRAIRIDDDLWNETRRIAAARQETATDVIRRCLTAYIDTRDCGCEQ